MGGYTRNTTDQQIIGTVVTGSTVSSTTKFNSLQEFVLSKIPSQMTYHEMAEIPLQNENPIEQLERNLSRLSELQSRLSFVMREVRYQMKI